MLTMISDSFCGLKRRKKHADFSLIIPPRLCLWDSLFEGIFYYPMKGLNIGIYSGQLIVTYYLGDRYGV